MDCVMLLDYPHNILFVEPPDRTQIHSECLDRPRSVLNSTWNWEYQYYHHS